MRPGDGYAVGSERRKEEEIQALLEVLDAALRNLCEEVYKTEKYEYGRKLQQREALVKDLLARLAQAR